MLVIGKCRCYWGLKLSNGDSLGVSNFLVDFLFFFFLKGGGGGGGGE